MPTTKRSKSKKNDRLTIEYIPLSQVRRWGRNPKLHDLQTIVESVQKYGFNDPPKFDAALNEGEGGLVEGNGRDLALEWMQQQGLDPPRGVAVNEDGEWAMPILFGNDSPSQQVAEAYAIDHNNIGLLGGEYTAFEIARMWDQKEYVLLLADLAQQGEQATSVDGDSIDALVKMMSQQDTSFLDGFLSLTDNGGGDHPAFESGLVQFALPVTAEQRKVILTAINQAKSEFEVMTSTEGLLAICQQYMEQ